MNLLLGLITSTIVGSIIFLTLLLLRPATEKVFSKSWHYYCLIVPLFFLLGGTRIAIDAASFVPSLEPQSYLPSSIAQEAPASITPEYLRSFELNDLLNMPIYNEAIAINPVAYPSVASQFLAHLEATAVFLLLIWVFGTIIFIAISTKKYLEYRRAVLRNSKCVDIGTKVPVIVSMAAHTPMLLGTIAPIIVLPDMRFADEELEMILAHEMEHYRRKDLFIKLLMLIANAVHWFNPVVYMLNRQLDAMCELSCDEKVVSEMDIQSRKFYGETILQVLKHSTEQRNFVGKIAFATNLCNSKKNFKRRLLNMVNTKKMKKSIAALALAVGVLVVVGGFAASNLIASVIPNVYVYDSETEQNDLAAELPVQNYVSDAPTVIQTDTREIGTSQSQFLWPLDEHVRVTAPFGLVRNPISGREEFHTGIDIPAPFGTPILAAKDGNVAFADWQGANGYTIVIDHGNGHSTLYAHASRISVNKGQFVSQGETIAFVGSTGRSTGYHLHFEVRLNSDIVDPYAYFVGTAAMRVDGVAYAPAIVTEPMLFNVYTIEHTERNISFLLAHTYFDDSDLALPHYYLSFETAAKLVSDAIYQEFGFCIDGLTGNMFFVRRMYDESWIGNILSEELTTHSHGNELFHFVIDAANGNVLSLYMNTEATPFHG